MKAVEFWFWMMSDGWSGKLAKSPCRFTEAEALKRDPQATRIPGSREIREVPESDDELARAQWSNARFK